MLFSEGERRELAEFFAKRFSDDSVRSLRRAAGIDAGEATADPTDAWPISSPPPVNRRRLPNLAIVAKTTRQTKTFRPSATSWARAASRNRVVTGLAAASIALGFGIAGWSMGAQGDVEHRRRGSHTRGRDRGGRGGRGP